MVLIELLERDGNEQKMLRAAYGLLDWRRGGDNLSARLHEAIDNAQRERRGELMMDIVHGFAMHQLWDEMDEEVYEKIIREYKKKLDSSSNESTDKQKTGE